MTCSQLSILGIICLLLSLSTRIGRADTAENNDGAPKIVVIKKMGLKESLETAAGQAPGEGQTRKNDETAPEAFGRLVTDKKGIVQGAVGATVMIPVTGNMLSCLMGLGPMAGGSYSRDSVGEGSITAVGPGAYLGFGCEKGIWTVEVRNHVIWNSLPDHDPLTRMTAIMGNRLDATLRVSKNIAVGAWVGADTEFRGDKAPGVYGGTILIFTWGGSDSKKLPKTKTGKAEAKAKVAAK